MVDKAMAEEWMGRSMQRSMDAYNRIKMNLTIHGKRVDISPKYKEPVERVKQVIEALDGIERAKSILLLGSVSNLPAKRLQEYKEYKKIQKDLNAYKKTEIISGLLEKIQAQLQETEHFLDEVCKKKLILSLQGKTHENWAEFLVDKKRKSKLFVVLVEKYAEALIKHSLKDGTEAICNMSSEIEILAKRGFVDEQVSSVLAEVNQFIGMRLVHQVGKQCYIFVKSISSPIKKLKDFLEFLESFLSAEIGSVMKKHKIHQKVQTQLAQTYTTLYKEAEEQFITGKINQKRLLDRDMFYLIRSLHDAKKFCDFLDVKINIQKKLEEFYKISEKKCTQAASKWEGLIFSLNSISLINALKNKKIPENDVVHELAQEMRRKVTKSVENPEVKNKIGELLRHIEKTSMKARHYSMPEEHRVYIISEYKKIVREIGNRFGGLDDVSDSHLSSIIEGFFNGPVRKITE
ncbi:hypothetical protein NEPAR06_1052 [Nematocida parisii]|uniref:uncharacterized protein n=1 Tax=Nematocida parisii (strain ERTm1 / ATCC PRA-289) TaxID=881290 RepID=UPI000264B17B|nr:uncharacterized protein NEPG_01190 [Nematocida parisii ERTm1]EIJ93618.1 hypothetical protein NEPG_01190 [Nematocida parisii ERTm1]KAI5142268.1 hypothetical protein NEPAR07_0010 [Nematocida parisii]KAI5154352.1 hypothetical protein NEPAR06_1052 [Nematocida parisii]KAI5158651.1 hypothetical protein NEPAR05_2178 [Nematocida parisii]|eukprot:XP_013059018.1 hypothetical protein NEPG_01190 [Nematocida parisii ERTm1]